MDRPDSLTPDMDTSLLIAKESSLRGHEVYYTEIDEIWLENNIPACKSRLFKYSGGNVEGALSDRKEYKIDAFDIVIMRKDPPIDDVYISATYILDYVKIPVINSSQSLRDINEKIIIGKWPQFIPDSYVFGNKERVISFLNENPTKKWVIKPLNMFNGMDIFKVWADYEKLDSTMNTIFRSDKFVVVQEFIERVSYGDKKIFLLGKEILGAMNRLPAEGEFRANIHLGAQAEQCVLNDIELNISKEIGEFLLDKGVHLSCLDIIDNKLTEVNITSPSGIPEINRVDNSTLEIQIVDYLEQLIK